jgi:hypothetical protein
MMKSLIPIAAAVLIFIGCGPNSVVLDQKFSNYDTANFLSSDSCQNIIVDVQDKRKDKQSLGRLYHTQVSSEDAVQWLANALAAVGFETKPVQPDGRRVLNILVELKLAYIKSSSSSMATNLVVGVRLDDGTSMRYVRGTNCMVNWSNSPDAIKASFDLALKKVLAQIIESTEAYCEKEANHEI